MYYSLIDTNKLRYLYNLSLFINKTIIVDYNNIITKVSSLEKKEDIFAPPNHQYYVLSHNIKYIIYINV